MDKPVMDPASPARRLGRYEITGVLGRGAMGDVYEALDPTIQRRVAIKTLDKRLSDATFVARFLSEARAVGRLAHPNIVQVYDAAEQDDLAYMVMELVEGSSLQDHLQQHPELPLDDVVSITTELLEALGYAHARGVVHRDVKPSNVMLTETGTVKLTDFGVAYVDDAVNRTSAGTVIGTPTFMSPEQVRGEAVSAASDQFAVGLLLYRMLTGRNAFAGDSLPTVALAILHAQPPAPSTLVEGLSPGSTMSCCARCRKTRRGATRARTRSPTRCVAPRRRRARAGSRDWRRRGGARPRAASSRRRRRPSRHRIPSAPPNSMPR